MRERMGLAPKPSPRPPRVRTPSPEPEPEPPAKDPVEDSDAEMDEPPAAAAAAAAPSRAPPSSVPISLDKILNRSDARFMDRAGHGPVGGKGKAPAKKKPAPQRKREPAVKSEGGGASASSKASKVKSEGGGASRKAVVSPFADEEDELWEDDDEEEGDDEEMEEVEEDDEEEVEAGKAERWPKLKAEPCAPHEPLKLGPRPRHNGSTIYSENAELNANVAQYLRDYQKEGVEWLWNQYANDKGGILGDEMGLGKTVQIAGFLSAVLDKSATSDDKHREFPLPENDCRRALVVVPKSTLDNWKRELSTWGCFKVQEMYGAGRERAFDAARNRECEVVLTTYDTVLNNLEDIKKVEWEVSVWDEVHQIKNEKSKRNRACNAIPCKRRYGLTGTPMSNEYKELWVMFDFASSGNVGTVKDFNARYGKALADGFNKSAKQWQIQRRLRTQKEIKELMDMWMLQRFKTIIADQMPKKRDNIVICRLAAEQEEVYMRVLDSPDYQQLINMDNPCRCGSGEKTRNCHMLDMDGVLAKWSHPDGENCNRCPSCLTMPALLQLQKIANHLELLKPEEGMSDEVFQKQSDFARMAFGDPCMM